MKKYGMGGVPDGSPWKTNRAERPPSGPPLLFQQGKLQGVFVQRGAVGIIDKRNKFPEQPFLPHAQFAAQPLGREVIVLHIGVNAPGIFLPEQEIYISKGRFVGIAFSAPLGKKNSSTH